MSRKLTEQEQQTVLVLAKLLGRQLPVQHRCNAGGIASGLVRVQGDVISTSDVNDVLAKYKAGKDVRECLVTLGVLVPAAEHGPDGATCYRLAVPEEADAAETGADKSSDAARPARADKATAGAQAKGTPRDDAPLATGDGTAGAGSSAGAGAPANATPAPATAPKAIARAERPKPPAKAKSAAPKAPAKHRPLGHLDTVRKQTPELTATRLQIIELDPRMWINGWLLSTPDAFTEHEAELRALSAALEGRPSLGDGTLSCRELSYQVFGDEKYLGLEEDGRKLLHLMGLQELLCTKPQAKLELVHHIPRHHRHMRIVVSENLDPYLNMRDAMYRDGAKRILDERVHGIVFGEGHVVNDPHKLPDLLDALGAESVEVLYWGDIDRAGLQIMQRLATALADRYPVAPFVAAYRRMLKLAMRRFPDPLANEPCDQANVPIVGVELLEPHLKPRELEYLRAVLEGSRLVPQEIVTRHDL